MTTTKPAFAPPYKRQRETKARYEERSEFLRRLWKEINPGDTIYTVLRHVSSSGMYRAIDLFMFSMDGDRLEKSWLSYWAAKAGVGDKFDERRDAIGVSGAGMDMGFSLVYDLSSMLFPDGFECVGDRCPSNDHTNGDRIYTPHHHRSGGYALRQEWV